MEGQVTYLTTEEWDGSLQLNKLVEFNDPDKGMSIMSEVRFEHYQWVIDEWRRLGTFGVGSLDKWIRVWNFKVVSEEEAKVCMIQ
jgi:hypothetical protein